MGRRQGGESKGGDGKGEWAVVADSAEDDDVAAGATADDEVAGAGADNDNDDAPPPDANCCSIWSVSVCCKACTTSPISPPLPLPLPPPPWPSFPPPSPHPLHLLLPDVASRRCVFASSSHRRSLDTSRCSVNVPRCSLDIPRCSLGGSSSREDGSPERPDLRDEGGRGGLPGEGRPTSPSPDAEAEKAEVGAARAGAPPRGPSSAADKDALRGESSFEWVEAREDARLRIRPGGATQGAPPTGLAGALCGGEGGGVQRKFVLSLKEELTTPGMAECGCEGCVDGRVELEIGTKRAGTLENLRAGG